MLVEVVDLLHVSSLVDAVVEVDRLTDDDRHGDELPAGISCPVPARISVNSVFSERYRFAPSATGGGT